MSQQKTMEWNEWNLSNTYSLLQAIPTCPTDPNSPHLSQMHSSSMIFIQLYPTFVPSGGANCLTTMSPSPFSPTHHLVRQLIPRESDGPKRDLHGRMEI